MTVDKREEALAIFRDATGLEELQGVIQEGRNPDTAVYTLDFGPGQRVRLGNVDTLWSQATFAKRLLPAGYGPESVKASEWRPIIQSLVLHAAEVRESPDDTYESTVLDWLRAYTSRASSDRDGAAPNGEPFIDGDTLHVTATDLARYVRREYSETVKLAELRQGLRDLGFEQHTVRYRISAGKNSHRSSSTSYYRASLSTLDAGDEE